MASWDPELVRKVWRQVNHDAPYKWEVKVQSVRKLAELVRQIPISSLTDADRSKANVMLRRALHLPSFVEPERTRVASWIVRDWGRVTSRSEQDIGTWMRELGEFGVPEVETFVQRRGIGGVSSWSKLLAFADPNRYAIYDARTALTLNCGLAAVGDNRRFFMPDGRVYEPKAARSSLNGGQTMKRARNVLRSTGELIREPNYECYLDYLGAAVATDLAPTLLEAEMYLFANAPAAASQLLKLE